MVQEIGKIEIDQTEQLKNDIIEILYACRELSNRQGIIVQTLTKFQIDLNNLGVLIQDIKNDITSIKKRNKKMSKRSGQEDNDEDNNSQ